MTKTELQAEMFRRGLTCNPKIRTILSEDNARIKAEQGPSGTPKGMSSMTLMELRGEAEMLGIELGAKETRGSLMLKIRDTTAPETTVMTLGRFKGTAYKDVPENYAQWASREAEENGDNMHPDLRRFVNWWRAAKKTDKMAPKKLDMYDPEKNAVVPPPPVSETGSSAAWSVVTPSRGYSSKPVLPGVQATAKEHTTSDRGGGPISHGTGRPRRHPGGDHGAGDQTGPPAGRPWRQQLRSDGTGGEVDDATGNTKVQF